MKAIHAFLCLSILLLLLFWCLLTTSELSCQSLIDRNRLKALVVKHAGEAKIEQQWSMKKCETTNFLQRKNDEQIEKRFHKNFLSL
jgi:hypothetical protein